MPTELQEFKDVLKQILSEQDKFRKLIKSFDYSVLWEDQPKSNLIPMITLVITSVVLVLLWFKK